MKMTLLLSRYLQAFRTTGLATLTALISVTHASASGLESYQSSDPNTMDAALSQLSTSSTLAESSAYQLEELTEANATKYDLVVSKFVFDEDTSTLKEVEYKVVFNTVLGNTDEESETYSMALATVTGFGAEDYITLVILDENGNPTPLNSDCTVVLVEDSAGIVLSAKASDFNYEAFSDWVNTNTGEDLDESYIRIPPNNGNAYINISKAYGDFTGDIIGAASIWFGGAMYVKSGATIENITGNFLYNGIVNTMGYAFGGAILNWGGEIGNIKGDFIANFVYTSNSYVFGGAITNYGSGYIGSITGDFLCNIAGATLYNDELISTSSYGGAIYNSGTSSIGSISGEFNSNKAVSSGGVSYGGAIYNSGSIEAVSGDFISNTAEASGEDSVSLGGAICNFGSITSLSGNFLYNDAAAGGEACGGAIFNAGEICYTLTSGVAYALGNTATTSGGFLYANPGSKTEFNISEGAQFEVGAYNAEGSVDSIWVGSTAQFIKSGTGTMIVRADIVNYGNIEVKEGCMIIEGNDNPYWYQGIDAYALFEGSDSSSFNAVLILGKCYIVEAGSSLSVGETSTSEPVESNESSEVLAGNVSLSSDSLLIVHASATGGDQAYVDTDTSQSAIIGDGTSTIDVAEGAKLIVESSDATGDIRITQGMSTESTSALAWETENIKLVNPLYEVVSSEWRVEEDGSNSFYITGAESDTGKANSGQLAAIGGVASNMGMLQRLIKDTTMARFAVNTSSNNTEISNGASVWATPVYATMRARGLDSGGLSNGYDTYFRGINLGTDYSYNNDSRYGFAMHIGDGDTHSKGDFWTTTNDFDYYGLTAYAAYRKNRWGYYADVNVSMTNNELVQSNPNETGNLMSDTNAYALSAELRADYTFETKRVDITPFALINYMYMIIDNYNVSQNGSHVLNVDCTAQHVITLPIGVSFSKEYQYNNWQIMPIAELSAIFRMGDLDAKSVGSAADIDAWSMRMEAYNPFGFATEARIEFRKEQSAYGLGYGLELSEDLIMHQFKAYLRCEF